MLEANRSQVNSIQLPQETGPVLVALDHLEGEIKNLCCAINALQAKVSPIAYYAPKECGESDQSVKSGCLVYEKIEDRISELYQMRQRLNSIIEALQV